MMLICWSFMLSLALNFVILNPLYLCTSHHSQVWQSEDSCINKTILYVLIKTFCHICTPMKLISCNSTIFSLQIYQILIPAFWFSWNLNFNKSLKKKLIKVLYVLQIHVHSNPLLQYTTHKITNIVPVIF
jgi:hypothetical protein